MLKTRFVSEVPVKTVRLISKLYVLSFDSIHLLMKQFETHTQIFGVL